MFEVQKDNYTPKNIFAGNFPVVTDVGPLADSATVRKMAPVMISGGKVKEVDSAGIANLCGIAADDSTDGGVVYYLTGEFFAAALTLPDSVTVEALKPAFRKLGIFLK